MNVYASIRGNLMKKSLEQLRDHQVRFNLSCTLCFINEIGILYANFANFASHVSSHISCLFRPFYSIIETINTFWMVGHITVGGIISFRAQNIYTESLYFICIAYQTVWNKYKLANLETNQTFVDSNMLIQ